jgi:hypothetical protein
MVITDAIAFPGVLQLLRNRADSEGNSRLIDTLYADCIGHLFHENTSSDYPFGCMFAACSLQCHGAARADTGLFGDERHGCRPRRQFRQHP